MITLQNKLALTEALHYNPALTKDQQEQILCRSLTNIRHPLNEEMGDFAGIWIRKMFYATAATVYEGHRHNHDHLSLLATGKVIIEVEGYDSKVFIAPTFIIIRKNKEHKITALHDETTWFCLFNHTPDGLDIYSKENDPMSDKIKVDFS